MRKVIGKFPGARLLYSALVGYRQRTLLATYVAGQAIRKLHIGCGSHPLDGWLNSDQYPMNPTILALDATKPFPFDDETFDYIFSEHMIEHVAYSSGLAMLEQCRRILKSNGRIRVSTPDLDFLIDLYRDGKSQLQQDYIKWSSDTFIKNSEYTDTMVINNFVRDWGHVFIYDKKTLRRSLELAGFVDIASFRLNDSNDPSLRNLENEARMPAEFLQLESFTLEGRKP